MTAAAPKVTVPELQRFKASGQKITALTAYDYPFARILDGCGIDVLLVGDSVSTVVQGMDTTIPVTMDEMVYHCKLVTRARPRALVVGDLPFLSYQAGICDAIANAGRLLKEGAVEAVKLEGGVNIARVMRAIVNVDIPVMAHIGLTPQSVHRMGGFKVQGKKSGRQPGARERLIEDAQAVADAGAFAVVLEGVPMDLAHEITQMLPIPTIGIGAGPYCDGQILVIHDILGLSERYAPKFAKRYADLQGVISQAVNSYISEVRGGVFPADAQSFH
jgi:3-methyl-2-oxobutanoate hydroxymethyltransferase